MLGSPSCVWGGDCLWCSIAAIVCTSVCEAVDLWRCCAAESFPYEYKWRYCKTELSAADYGL